MKPSFQSLALGKDDIVLVTVGSLEYNIFPKDKDIAKAEKFFQGKFGKNKVLVVPPIYSLEIVRQ